VIAARAYTGIASLAVCLVATMAFGPARAGEVRIAGPEDYREVVARLQPGDTLALEAGEYEHGLDIHGLQGTKAEPIHIAGPEGEPGAVFLGKKGRNIVSIKNAAWVTIRDLTLDGQGLAVDAVKAEGPSRFAHHITLRNLEIRNLKAHEQINGISTKCPAWGWVIRDNVIRDAGAGMYLGDSDGSAPFVDGTIEHNLILDPIGYGIQIKHQEPRPELEGLPTEPSTTVIRHNVFAKTRNAGKGKWARPSLLVGHFPPRGPGMSDRYAIYGNVFYRNPTERLFQGEGNVALYDNLFVNPEGSAIAFMPHNDEPRNLWMFHNTIVARDAGLYFRPTDATRTRMVVGNAIFADEPVRGRGADAVGTNVLESYAAAPDYLRKPHGPLGDLDLAPVGDGLAGRGRPPVEVMVSLPDAAMDFAGRRRDGEFAGAYAGSLGEDAAYWRPVAAVKPRVDGGG
jgi:hypothetical protein